MKFRSTSAGNERVDPRDTPRLQRDSPRVAHLRSGVDGRVAPPVSSRTHLLSPSVFGDRRLDRLLSIKDLSFIFDDSRRRFEGDAGSRVAQDVRAEESESPLDGSDVELHRKDRAAQIYIDATKGRDADSGGR